MNVYCTLTSLIITESFLGTSPNHVTILGSAVAHGSESFVDVIRSRRYVYIPVRQCSGTAVECALVSQHCWQYSTYRPYSGYSSGTAAVVVRP